MTEGKAPTPETIRRARLFWQQSAADLKSARASLRRKEYLQSSFLSLQASLNGLSAVCHLHGHFQLPTDGPVPLLGLCAEADPRFAEAMDAFPSLERVLEQDPFAPERQSQEEAELGKACLDEGNRLLKLVKGYLKENRARFFKP